MQWARVDLQRIARQAAVTDPVAAAPEKAIDYAYRAVHLTATTAKAIVKDYYGNGHRRSQRRADRRSAQVRLQPQSGRSRMQRRGGWRELPDGRPGRVSVAWLLDPALASAHRDQRLYTGRARWEPTLSCKGTANAVPARSTACNILSSSSCCNARNSS